MFGNWFTEKNIGSNSERNDLENPACDAEPGPTSISTRPKLDVSSDTEGSGPLPSNSPHDAIIDQIDEELRDLQGVGSSGKSTPPKLRSRELPENMYDPFDGQSIGLLIPGEFEEAEDDLWTHLAEIRNLQSDIARMHAQMERLGENDRFYGQDHTAEDDTVNMEDEAKTAKAAEFAKLSDRFNGRKEAIDAIMQKLQTLSNSINDFHSSRAPIFRSLASPGNTEDKKNFNRRATASSQSEDALGRSTMSNRILAVSLEDPLKDSPESMNRSLAEHS